MGNTSNFFGGKCVACQVFYHCDNIVIILLFNNVDKSDLFEKEKSTHLGGSECSFSQSWAGLVTLRNPVAFGKDKILGKILPASVRPIIIMRGFLVTMGVATQEGLKNATGFIYLSIIYHNSKHLSVNLP